jgi:hypothetical protein
MKTNFLPGLLFSCAWICSAQTAALPDPTLDSTGLPAYVKLLPRPAAEPWRRITAKERFDHYASRTFSLYAGLGAVAGGAISQAIDSPDEWRQGWGPYGVRVASSYGGTFVANTITYGASAVFRDDNRYFRSRKNGFKARLASALISPYAAHNNAGHLRFSTSSFLGGVGGAAIPLMWSPASWQGWNNVAVNYGLWYSGLAGVNLVREFYPSLAGYYRNKRPGKGPSADTHPKK